MPRRKKYKIQRPRLNLSPETKRDIFVIFVFAIAILSILSMFDLTGAFGQSINNFWQIVFGWLWWLWPFILIIIGYLLINLEKLEIKTSRWIGLFLFILTLAGILQLFIDDKTFEAVKLGEGGGIIGYIVAMPLEKIASFWGALIILIALFLISLLLFFETSFNSILEKFHLPEINLITNLKEKIRQRREDRQEYDSEDVGFEQKEIDVDYKNTSEKTEAGEKEQSEMFPHIKKKYPKIDIPIDLLTGKMTQPSAGDIKASQSIIKKALNHFGIEVEMGEVSVGPTVTQYSFKPASGVKVSQITTLNNDLALALAAHPIRIEAPIPGKSLIGVEVPNPKKAVVPLREVLTSKEFKNRESNLMLCLGKDVAGEPYLANLDKMPHLLVAGATNSGKTVCLNSIIVSLLYQNQPDALKLILVDPKRVEMTQYNGVPHLNCEVITEIKKIISALRWTVKEMEHRFEILQNTSKRNIDSYNSSNPSEKMPYLIIIVDELADLMSIAAIEIEQAVIRLAQKSRAVGIHLILATQRPSVNIITGLIKANITSRIAFSVASSMDSRTILDFSGAEKLLGKGDMLFISSDLSKPKRIQGAYLSDNEIESVAKYLKSKGQPEYNEAITESQSTLMSGQGTNSFFEDDGDELLPEAKELVIKAGKASASYLQRRLRIGYARAARILDLLEEQGVIGPQDGSKAREIYSAPEELEADEILEKAEEGENDENIEEDLEDEENNQ